MAGFFQVKKSLPSASGPLLPLVGVVTDQHNYPPKSGWRQKWLVTKVVGDNTNHRKT
jgi:hypothetical protein